MDTAHGKNKNRTRSFPMKITIPQGTRFGDVWLKDERMAPILKTRRGQELNP